jgi:alpha-D-xyloside xylohydrolase
MAAINASAIRLRYRLLPYTYASFRRAAAAGYTVQRALSLAFPDDAAARNVADAFLWGDALLVAPIVDGTLSRSVYVPDGGGGAPWADFHTGADVAPGAAVLAAPLDRAPLLVRPGGIVVLGPDLQHTGERPADPLEVRVRAGADGDFELYEDDGATAVGAGGGATNGYATIKVSWDDGAKTLTVGARGGPGYDGMLQARTLRLVCVGAGRGAGVAPSDADVVLQYDGSEATAKLCAETAAAA